MLQMFGIDMTSANARRLQDDTRDLSMLGWPFEVNVHVLVGAIGDLVDGLQKVVLVELNNGAGDMYLHLLDKMLNLTANLMGRKQSMCSRTVSGNELILHSVSAYALRSDAGIDVAAESHHYLWALKNKVFVLKEERKGLARRYEDRSFPAPLPGVINPRAMFIIDAFHFNLNIILILYAV
ncbi:hypothetical protein EJ110_NYTH52498 [Nymphaea thermarum]|nr:hypothetical protein EJ110_NYTH52498 [Nymphaea thermarum]